MDRLFVTVARGDYGEIITPILSSADPELVHRVIRVFREVLLDDGDDAPGGRIQAGAEVERA